MFIKFGELISIVDEEVHVRHYLMDKHIKPSHEDFTDNSIQSLVYN
jgi:hypothetical protein